MVDRLFLLVINFHQLPSITLLTVLAMTTIVIATKGAKKIVDNGR